MTVQDVVEEVLGEVGLLLFFRVEELHRRLELWRDGVVDVLFELCLEQVRAVMSSTGSPPRKSKPVPSASAEYLGGLLVALGFLLGAFGMLSSVVV